MGVEELLQAQVEYKAAEQSAAQERMEKNISRQDYYFNLWENYLRFLRPASVYGEFVLTVDSDMKANIKLSNVGHYYYRNREEHEAPEKVLKVIRHDGMSIEEASQRVVDMVRAGDLMVDDGKMSRKDNKIIARPKGSKTVLGSGRTARAAYDAALRARKHVPDVVFDVMNR